MKLVSAAIRNFRRLEDVEFDIENDETVFVGPNNSGKTSATAIFRAFLGARGFTVHDFSVGRIVDFDAFGTACRAGVEAGPLAETRAENAAGAAVEPMVEAAPETESEDSPGLPQITLDLWFEVEPTHDTFGIMSVLLPRFESLRRVGLRLTYGVQDVRGLRTAYLKACSGTDGAPERSLSAYLGVDDNFKRHCEVGYFALVEGAAEDGGRTVEPKPLEREEGAKFLKKVIRVEFIDAQRNINDDDSSRSNRLSSAFAAYYRKNLQQPAHAAEAHEVIDRNNTDLSQHYSRQFAPLMNLIRKLGVPSINDRDLQIVSALSPEVALRGSTELIYVDPGANHSLPELYNGLGFKNLIYMAIQARHFHSQWMATESDRPLCLLIFIEEPEVHLHAQVQQTFIRNIWSVIQDSAAMAAEPGLSPQLIVTTHSSHIVETVKFEKVRYFQRCHPPGSTAASGIRNVSTVHSLRAFRPEPDVIEGVPVSPSETLAFLERYLRLTHCDLFFADGVILVEGAAEKLLLPSMIASEAPRLLHNYLTILEVGGAYAHRFEGLLGFLKIPYLVITDLDSAAPTGPLKACRADTPGARTSNASLKKLCGCTTIDELMNLSQEAKQSEEKDRCIAFQVDIPVQKDVSLRPRTLEEAIAYANLPLIQDGTLSLGIELPEGMEELYQRVFERVKSTEFKKTDFALSLVELAGIWNTPNYIVEGLQWLAARLNRPGEAVPPAGAGAADAPFVNLVAGEPATLPGEV